MELRGSSGAVWVEALDPDPDDGTAPGEILLRVDVSNCGFVGWAFPCVRATALQGFAAALEAMCERQTGQALLPGLRGDADGFSLRVAWVDRGNWRCLAATGRITRYANVATDGGPHANELRFGLDFPADALAGVAAAVRAMAGGLAAPGTSSESSGT